MIEIDLISAFHGAVGLNSDTLFGYVSLMSAFLVMSYLAAHKLPGVLAWIVAVLFSVVSALLILRLFLNGSDAAALHAHILELQRMGEIDVGEFGTFPSWVATVVVALEILTTVGGYLGCIYFFLHQRRSTGDA